MRCAIAAPRLRRRQHSLQRLHEVLEQGIAGELLFLKLAEQRIHFALCQSETGIGVKFPTLSVLLSSPEADAALYPLQDTTLGSLTMYVIPETSSLLPQVGSSTLWCQPL